MSLSLPARLVNISKYGSSIERIERFRTGSAPNGTYLSPKAPSFFLNGLPLRQHLTHGFLKGFGEFMRIAEQGKNYQHGFARQLVAVMRVLLQYPKQVG